MSPRLLRIANMVQHPTLVDVGTDHAHLPIYLAKNRNISRAMATDISAGPLERGRQNARNAGVSHIIDFIQCAGLEGVPADVYDTCTISGMGGEMIITILEDYIGVAKKFQQLILSPQRSVPKLRRFLHANGFAINDEDIVEDNGKLYNILDCSPGVIGGYDKVGYEFGQILLDKQHPLLVDLINQEIKRIERINLEVLPKERREGIIEFRKLCLEVLSANTSVCRMEVLECL